MPIVGIAVIAHVGGLVLPGNGLLGVNGGAALDFLFGERHMQGAGVPSIMAEGGGRDQHGPAAEPAASLDDEIADSPGFVIEIKLTHLANFSVCCLDRDALQTSNAV